MNKTESLVFTHLLVDRPHLWHSLSCFCNLALPASWVQSAFSPHPCISKILLILQGLFFNELHSTSLHTWVTHLIFITPYYSYLKKSLICPTNSLSTERIHNLGVFKLYISFFHSVLYVRITIWNINWSTSPSSSVQNIHFHVLYFWCYPLPKQRGYFLPCLGGKEEGKSQMFV